MVCKPALVVVTAAERGVLDIASSSRSFKSDPSRSIVIAITIIKGVVNIVSFRTVFYRMKENPLEILRDDVIVEQDWSLWSMVVCRLLMQC